MSMKFRSCRILAVGTSAIFASPPLLADSSAATGDVQAGLEEVVVTAQRRSENLERTPVAVTVLGSDDLAEQQILTESDLRTAVPGLTVRETLGSNEINYSIRGQTVDAFSGSQPAVLPYVNEIQVGGPGGSSAFYDLQSIQVLKGPQGTLFGRNATGGAVLMTTAKPTDTFGGYVAASGGNYNAANVEGALNVPIIPGTVLARVAAIYQTRDGFQYNLFTNQKVGGVDRYGVRPSLTIRFSDAVKNEFVLDFAHAGGSSEALVLHTVAPQFRYPSALPANLLFTPYLDTLIGVPGAFAAFSAANPKTPPGGLYSALAGQVARGPFTVDVNNPGAHRANNVILSNVTTVDITNNTQFKNVFGYTNLGQRDGEDVDASPYQIDGPPIGQIYGQNHNVKQFSEEPQLIGKTLEGKLSYVAGAYYSNEKSYNSELASLVDLAPISPPVSDYNATLNRDKSIAGYGQGTYDLSGATGIEGFSVNAGIRYTSEKVSMAQIFPSQFYNSQNPLLHQLLQDTFNKASWQFGLQEQLNSNIFVYAVTRHSFRSGGFNDIGAPTEGFAKSGGNEFDAEVATDGELGAKFQGFVAAMPARLNVAAYIEEIKNAQRVANTITATGPEGFTSNVPRTRVTGLEMEGQINPASWLKLGASVAYTNAKFTDNKVTLPGIPTPTTTGFGPYPDTPRWAGSVFSEVSVPLTRDVVMSLRGELFDETSTYFSSTNSTLTPGTQLPGYAVANFTLSIGDGAAGWSVAGIVKNAFNRVYYVGGLAALNVLTLNMVLPGDPRTIVGEVRYKF
jgi:iron complex outermembrane recepter protein